MQTVRLGRTGLEVSVAGLGSGGSSQLGIAQGRGEENATRIIHAALDLGVTFFDTAMAYGTEEVVGRALGVRRKDVVLCSKSPVRMQNGQPSFLGSLATAKEFRQAVEASMRRIGTDYIDIYMLHGVDETSYTHARDTLLAELQEMRKEGKIGFAGLSERLVLDIHHKMLNMSLSDDCWDVVMLGYNLINQSVARKILPTFSARDVGVLGMYAVRRALNSNEAARKLIDQLVALGEVDAASLDAADPLGFLTSEGHASSLTDAAYRFSRHQPGIHVVLTGTGSMAHLRENLEAINRPPLPEPVVRRLKDVFARVVSLTGD